MERMKAEKVASVLLEEPMEVVVGERSFWVAPPTMATLMAVSVYIDMLPSVQVSEQAEVSEILGHIKDGGAIAEILAIFILGKERKEKKKREELVELIVETLTFKQAYEVLMRVIEMSNTAFFLGTIIFLNEVNLTKPTKTTALGQ